MDIIEITNCPDHFILLGERHQDFARALANRAVLCCGHPWVMADAIDDEMLEQTRRCWADVAPGWMRFDIAQQLAHDAIAHHLQMCGHKVIDRVQRDALLAIECEPEIGSAMVLVAGHADNDLPDEISVLTAVLTDRCAAVVQQTIDSNYFDTDDGQYSDRFVIRWMHGERIAEIVCAYA